MSSEVTRLMEQIALECQAMNRAVYGYAAVARHEIITNKYKMLGQYMDQLAPLVGPEEAERIACETYNAIIGQEGGGCERDKQYE